MGKALVHALVGPLGAAVVALGCGSDAPAPIAPVVMLGAASAAAVAPPVRSRERILAHAACEDLSPCTVVAMRPVRVVEGVEHVLAIVQRGVSSEAGIAPPEELPDVHSFDGEADVFSASYGGCTDYEAWVLVFGGVYAERTRLLTHICNDGHGAAGVGEDRLTVKDGRVIVEQSGGSNWRWSRTSTVSIDDGVLERRHQSWFTMGEETSETWWDYVAFRGTSSWGAARCDPNKPSPAPDPDGEVPSFTYHPIPRVETDAGFHGSYWSTLRLDGCMTVFDGKTTGFLLGSGKVEPSARFRILASGNDILVEVEDDDFYTEGAAHDRLEIWSTDAQPGGYEPCVSPARAASGISIDLRDGAASAIGARSATAAPLPWVGGPARVDALPGVRRMKVIYPKLPLGLTVVYRDVDRSKPARDVATSPLDTRDVSTIGGTYALEGMQCVTAGHVLHAIVPAPARDEAALTEMAFTPPAP